MKLGAPQGSTLDLLFFLIYVNDFNQAIKFQSSSLFANDTNMLHFNKLVNKLVNKYFHLDLRNPAYWLNVSKISLNAQKFR